ncbi:(deoxy)nucleoside triphosphate pyrophosphohydrolase [Metabacillus malikii]|uniref:8-oxo-dGTP diphosphatase n=1 Tax=Metabacillus malikii TaxID=1504265 RepID=A0ABT9ZID5_9BACI|nr:(deoxy)nucleoside triphosphate pyrophosphohydrolase [Metabacillus malikii]MDQ0232046.1 8-oxo-dGTP diphosphatase [Metabacillus malikii]
MKKLINVVGAVIMKDGKILCAQRGNTKVLSSFWEFPGGKIEEGESPQQALHREIIEEMECEIEIEKLLDETVYEYDFGIVNLKTFKCKLTEGKPTLTEHTAMKWLFPHELNTLQWAPADIPTVEKLMGIVYK